jgi:RNA polymerase sigma-70 factor (ECF subfamily)
VLELPPEWFHDHFDTVWRLVARLGIPTHAIDDVVQEAFIAASRRRADIVVGHERSFLFGTALRLCSNYRQRASVRRELSHTELLEERPSNLPDAEELLIEKRLREQLEQLLSTLSDAHREVFVLYELEGFSVPEMSELLGVPTGTVASRLNRARANFSRAAARLQERARRTLEGS